MKAVVKQVHIAAGRRMLAISDIHGKLSWLKALLKRVDFNREDVLVLVGDMVEKGPDSLATLRYIMKLSQTHTVYAICGNCDNLAVDFTYGCGDMGRDFFHYYLKVWQEEALVMQMAREAGFDVAGPGDLPALQRLLAERFQPELEFLRGLPTILESEHFVFVHGGVPSYEHMEELDAWKCMKNDDFMGQGHSFPKYCVVGHWPVTLYRHDYPCCAPIIDRQRKIISIDGGCVLKEDGQLNALIIPAEDSQAFSWVSYDDCPVREALDGQDPSRDPVIIHWTDHNVEVEKQGEEFSLCLHKATGRRVWVLSKYLRRRGEELWCDDTSDYRLEVAPGDILSVVEETSLGYLVKKDDITGWYLGRLKESEKGRKY